MYFNVVDLIVSQFQELYIFLYCYLVRVWENQKVIYQLKEYMFYVIFSMEYLIGKVVVGFYLGKFYNRLIFII